MEGLITPISVATGVVLTGLTAVSLSSSVALGFALGWILQEMTGSLPLLAAAIVVLRPCVYFMFAGYSKGINAAQGPIFWGLFFAWIAHFILRTIRIRRKFHYLPGPPHSWILGHLPAVAAIAQKLPPDIAANVLMDRIRKEYNLNDVGAFALDTYPISSDFPLVIYATEVAKQVTQVPRQFLKHTQFRVLHRTLGNRGLILLEGKEHKETRALFNPGFSFQTVSTTLPVIIDDGEVFVTQLASQTRSDPFILSFEARTLVLMLDIIVRVGVGIEMLSQLQDHPLAKLWLHFESLERTGLINFSPEKLNFWRITRYVLAEWRLNRYVENLVRDKWVTLDNSFAKNTQENFANSIIDQALKKYRQSLDKELAKAPLPPDMLEIFRDNVKAIFHAGHDTTATALSYLIYELYSHPDILDRVRQEHDVVFGIDPSLAGDIIRKDPSSITRLPLTTAAIQETLRIDGASATIRSGQKGAKLRGVDGTSLDTDGLMLYPDPRLIQLDPAIYTRPHEFIPDRWLADRRPAGFPELSSSLFRSFEKGPRSCIGQEFAMATLRVMVVLLVRRFDFDLAYEELDRRLGRKPKLYEGVPRCYVSLINTGQPADGMPVFVKERPTQKSS